VVGSLEERAVNKRTDDKALEDLGHLSGEAASGPTQEDSGKRLASGGEENRAAHAGDVG